MIKVIIKFENGNIIEISGPADEVKKILTLYPGGLESVSLAELAETRSEDIKIAPSLSELKIQKALEWAKAQIGKYIQPCGTPGCKYNYNQPGEIICGTPNPRADDDDVKKENHESYHPFWNFYCMRFVRTAYAAPADYAKAEDMYQALSRAGVINTSSDIPLGALVFWYWSTFGHIGIYTGDEKVIHTGVNPSKKKDGIRESLLADITEVLNGYNHYEVNGIRTSYLGWANPPEKWLV